MSTFELISAEGAGEDDAMSVLQNELTAAISQIESQIGSWLNLVFEGQSSGAALQAILDGQAQS